LAKLIPTVTGTMGLLAALKEIGAQLLGFKFLFTIFQERTRAYYLHQGLTLGSARYIATGRGYMMSSNFVLTLTLTLTLTTDPDH
jgi:hypothetical protein